MRHGGDRVFKMRELPKDYSDKIEGKVDEPDVIESGAYRSIDNVYVFTCALSIWLVCELFSFLILIL